MDLLAMAGDSKVPGKVCAGIDVDGSILGFPLDYIAGVLTMDKPYLRDTLFLLEKQGRIETSLDARGNSIITLTSWVKYQSEYHRQKSYRSNSDEVTGKVTSETPAKLPVEGEVEVDGEIEEETSFGVFWDLYPRKVGKAKATVLWKKLSSRPELQKNALHGLKLWKQSEQWNRDDGKYIPYCSTFLAREQWADEPWTGAFEGR